MYSIYARLYPLRGRGGVSRKEHTEGVDANVERGNSSTVTSTTRPSKPKICKNGRTSRKSASLSSKEVYYNGKGAANSKPKKVDSMASAIPRHQRAISKWAQLPVSANVLGAPNIATQTTPPPLSIVVSPNASQPFPMSQLTDDTLLRSTATSEIHWPYKETMPVVPPAVPTNADVSWAPPVPMLPPPPPLAQQSLTYNSQGVSSSQPSSKQGVTARRRLTAYGGGPSVCFQHVLDQSPHKVTKTQQRGSHPLGASDPTNRQEPSNHSGKSMATSPHPEASTTTGRPTWRSHSSGLTTQGGVPSDATPTSFFQPPVPVPLIPPADSWIGLRQQWQGATDKENPQASPWQLVTQAQVFEHRLQDTMQRLLEQAQNKLEEKSYALQEQNSAHWQDQVEESMSTWQDQVKLDATQWREHVAKDSSEWQEQVETGILQVQDHVMVCESQLDAATQSVKMELQDHHDSLLNSFMKQAAITGVQIQQLMKREGERYFDEMIQKLYETKLSKTDDKTKFGNVVQGANKVEPDHGMDTAWPDTSSAAGKGRRSHTSKTNIAGSQDLDTAGMFKDDALKSGIVGVSNRKNTPTNSNPFRKSHKTTSKLHKSRIRSNQDEKNFGEKPGQCDNSPDVPNRNGSGNFKKSSQPSSASKLPPCNVEPSLRAGNQDSDEELRSILPKLTSVTPGMVADSFITTTPISNRSNTYVVGGGVACASDRPKQARKSTAKRSPLCLLQITTNMPTVHHRATTSHAVPTIQSKLTVTPSQRETTSSIESTVSTPTPRQKRAIPPVRHRGLTKKSRKDLSMYEDRSML